MFETIVRSTDRQRRRRHGLRVRSCRVLIAATVVTFGTAVRADVPATGAPRLRPSGSVSPRAIANAPTASGGKGVLTRPADMPRNEKRAETATPSSPWPTILASLCVVGLVVVAARWWRKHGPRITRGLPDEVLELLGRRPLDVRQSIHLVRLGHRILVLGSSADGLRTLAEIDDPVEVDYLSGLCRQTRDENVVGDTFRALFRRREESSNPPVNSPRETPRPAAATTSVGAADPVRPAAAAFPPPPPPRFVDAADEPGQGDGDLRRRLSERLRSPAPAGAEGGNR